MHSNCEGMPPDRVRAAQYMRMSTDRQAYSIEAQAAAMAIFAVRHEIDIVRTYKDEGRSGLTLQGRDGLRQLLSDVQNGSADYSRILVYDVSRWGRFQDSDESAHYEFICKQAGIKVIYCAEQFENNDSPTSVIIKAIKRLMAGEYSRELSVKVRDALQRGAARGFWQGGAPGYGLRRFMVDQDRRPKAMLRNGERKSLHTDRVILVPGPWKEVKIVQSIFREYVDKRRTPGEIAEMLNARGAVTSTGRKWSGLGVRLVLRNPNYAGHNRWHKSSKVLGKHTKRTIHPPDQWVITRDVFEAIVSPEIYDEAQRRLEARAHNISNERLIERFRQLLAERGTLSMEVVKDAKDMPSVSTVERRFGGLHQLYKILGFKQERPTSCVETRARLRYLRFELLDQVRSGLAVRGAEVRMLSKKSGLLLVNESVTFATTIVRRVHSRYGLPIWRAVTQVNRPVDFVLVQLVDETMYAVIAQYLFSGGGARKFDIYFSEPLKARYEALRLASTDEIFARIARLP